MLKELTRADWLAFLDLVEDRVPPILIMRGTRNLRAHYERYAVRFDDVLPVGSPNGLFEDIFIGRHRGIDVGYASVYGGPMASEIAHLFAVLGTKLIVQTGVCGGLGDGILAGDLVIPTSAGCGDGASQCYLPGVRAVAASPDLVRWAMDAPGTGEPRHAGPIWTTAALLAEGAVELETWHGEGFLAVDMETASSFAVAEAFGMRRLSIFNNPRHGSHLAMTETDKTAARIRGEDAVFALLVALIESGARPTSPDARRT